MSITHNILILLVKRAKSLTAFKLSASFQYDALAQIENPSDTLVAGWCLGHDFAVVGRYLIDWWAHNVESHPKMIIDILSDKDYLAEKYLPQHMWQKLKIWDKK